jgi:hypothetical protein
VNAIKRYVSLSIAAIVADLIRGRISKATLACFFAWLAVAVGYGDALGLQLRRAHRAAKPGRYAAL